MSWQAGRDWGLGYSYVANCIVYATIASCYGGYGCSQAMFRMACQSTHAADCRLIMLTDCINMLGCIMLPLRCIAVRAVPRCCSHVVQKRESGSALAASLASLMGPQASSKTKAAAKDADIDDDVKVGAS